jgi:hypothetical protein
MDRSATMVTAAGRYSNRTRVLARFPLPQWAGKFVILVDDGDADNPPDREGRGFFR